MAWHWLIKQAKKYYWVNIHFRDLDSLEVVYLFYQLGGLASLEATNKLN